ncbi:MAG: Gfo/Idh/MocA family oxidoreductase [Elusimicrobiota bacterium]|nr:Gfo/Idh/MocA family oxidoreductase [Elusimicrobiota bacterium]MDI6856231.1 Gfo/Idh/MocA family oxidoreductase [Candidatus Thermoplasmatota archaeon]
MNVGIIGAGLVGNKRARALCNENLVVVADVNEDRAKSLAEKHKCDYTSDWKEVVKNDNIDIVIVSTPNKYLAPITVEAIENGKHVLVEKPGATTPKDLKKMQVIAAKHKVKVKVGFNHRFHPAVVKAKEIFDRGDAGELMFLRGRYGHGGRLGYDKEWRADPEIAGGGEMLDQGIHLIDLARMFAGDFDKAVGFTETMFWNMQVEDNCFALLRNKSGKIAFLSASWTQWKNLFSFEVFGKTGLLVIDGLGGSYGEETLTFYKMKPELGIPDKFVYKWEEDNSWDLEFREFCSAIKEGREPVGNLDDAYKAMKLVFDIYKWSNKWMRK